MAKACRRDSQSYKHLLCAHHDSSLSIVSVPCTSKWAIVSDWYRRLASSIDEYFTRSLFWRGFPTHSQSTLWAPFSILLKYTGTIFGSRFLADYPEGRPRQSLDMLTTFLSIFSSTKVPRFSTKNPWFIPSLWWYFKNEQPQAFVFLSMQYDQGWSCASPVNFCGMIAQKLADISTFQKMRPIWCLSIKSTAKTPQIAERNTSSNQPFNTNQRHSAPWWE